MDRSLPQTAQQRTPALRIGLGAAAAALLAASASAQPVPSYDFDWVTIDHPGNRAATPDEIHRTNWDGSPVGRVDETFRITRTAVTTSQWMEFVEAYAPFWDGPPHVVAFTGFWIYYDWQGGYDMHPGAANAPTTMSWRMAARYANWLHNGKVNEAWAFEDGAYDTSTFTQNPDGSHNDQLTRHPDARFWIPNHDEWIKAVYYDPDRYGPGEEGYWTFPNQTDEPLTPGPPGEPGAETSAGPSGVTGPLDIGSYPDVQSYFGLLDVSGGVSDHTERLTTSFSRSRSPAGSFLSDHMWEFTDTPEFGGSIRPGSGTSIVGMRVASVIPSPGTTGVALAGLLLAARRRRR